MKEDLNLSNWMLIYCNINNYKNSKGNKSQVIFNTEIKKAAVLLLTLKNKKYGTRIKTQKIKSRK